VEGDDIMTKTSVTVRMDENLKTDLQNLVSNLGMDMTTFFTLAVKQAVREQALPFQPKVTSRYSNKAYQLAMNNTTYNSESRAVISKDDEWAKETEWDDIFEQMKKERGM
jgi:addiction module RelB/DinJ family antitoxin